MDSTREPHSVSLKAADGHEMFIVPSLSRPSFSQQFALPKHSEGLVPQITSRLVPTSAIKETDSQFILSPLLTLPPAFGSAYVGETFSCTLCANNELDSEAEKTVSSVKIVAEMQAPSIKIPLDLTPFDDDTVSLQLKPGESLQKIVRFELREEGNHVLAVSLSYSETTISRENSASSGRVRTFRKLYQFAAQPCLNIRTKVSDIQVRDSKDERSIANKNQRFALEAQLENMTDEPITLENVNFNSKPAFKSASLNWDMARAGVEQMRNPTLTPRDVAQVAFLIDHRHPGGDEGPVIEVTKDGRAVLGQLNIQWRTAMGDPGCLTTGWLMTRRR